MDEQPPAAARPGQPAAVGARDLLRFLPDVARLLADLARDPRVPWYAKAAAVGAAAYVVSPLDLVPDVVPVLGRMDDAWLVVRALRFLLREAGVDVVAEAWQGSAEGLSVLLWVAGVRD